MKKKTICFVVWNTKKSGGLAVIAKQAAWIASLGHNVSVCTIVPGDRNLFPKNIPFFSPFQFWNMRKFYDIVIATFWPTAYLLPFINSAKRVYFVQGWEPGFSKNIILSRLAQETYSFPYFTITVSPYLSEKLQKYKSSHVPIVSPGIDRTFFRVRPKRRPRRPFCQIFSVLSTYDYPKGVDILIDLVRKIKKSYPSFRFALASYEKNPPSPDFDVFYTNPSQMLLRQLYSQSDLFLHTSRSEGFPLPPLEAMASSCPVIATDSGGIRAYAKDRYNCFLFNRPEKLITDRLIEKVWNNTKTRRFLIRNAYRTAQQFSWEHSLKAWEKELFHS
ncbi:glycosyltransferase family 4 protein [Candidatus Gottesmanbacteria bacterium]|nr:glycosyltransferase family 4 protein [Candidatus Gottesmanbacteria bacterium]